MFSIVFLSFPMVVRWLSYDFPTMNGGFPKRPMASHGIHRVALLGGHVAQAEALNGLQLEDIIHHLMMVVIIVVLLVLLMIISMIISQCFSPLLLLLHIRPLLHQLVATKWKSPTSQMKIIAKKSRGPVADWIAQRQPPPSILPAYFWPWWLWILDPSPPLLAELYMLSLPSYSSSLMVDWRTEEYEKYPNSFVVHPPDTPVPFTP